MLLQHFEQSFLNLCSVYWYASCLHFFHLLLVKFHELNVRVALNWLHFVVDHLVVTVDTIYVLEDAIEYSHGHCQRRIDQNRSVEVNTRLHQVICAEMVLGKLSLIVTLETRLDCVDCWMLFQLVEESHASR